MDRTLTKPLIDALKADATLAGLATGGVWLAPAPSEPEVGARRPVIVLRLSGAALEAEDGCNADARVFRYAFAVEAPQDSVGTVRSILDRVFVLLHRVEWNAGAEWKVLRSVVTDLIEEAVVDGQARLHRIGGVLEVWADSQ